MQFHLRAGWFHGVVFGCAFAPERIWEGFLGKGVDEVEAVDFEDLIAVTLYLLEVDQVVSFSQSFGLLCWLSVD